MSNNLLFDPPKIVARPKASSGKEQIPWLSPLLFHPEKNRREYRGEIRLQGEKYIGLTQWGKKGKCGSHQKTVYSGTSIDEARRAVEVMLRKKVASGYLVQDGGPPFFRLFRAK